jgi:hypothetical protein
VGETDFSSVAWKNQRGGSRSSTFSFLSTGEGKSPKIYACSSIEDEFRQALSFAYQEASANPHAQIAIVVPNLPDYYLFLKRIAKTYLQQLPYVISAGLPLNQTPWVKSAFDILKSQTAFFRPRY